MKQNMTILTIFDIYLMENSIKTIFQVLLYQLHEFEILTLAN